jgi:hypothetical protein
VAVQLPVFFVVWEFCGVNRIKGRQGEKPQPEGFLRGSESGFLGAGEGLGRREEKGQEKGRKSVRQNAVQMSCR